MARVNSPCQVVKKASNFIHEFGQPTEPSADGADWNRTELGNENSGMNPTKFVPKRRDSTTAKTGAATKGPMSARMQQMGAWRY